MVDDFHAFGKIGPQKAGVHRLVDSHALHAQRYHIAAGLLNANLPWRQRFGSNQTRISENRSATSLRRGRNTSPGPSLSTVAIS